jgi:single-stranded-DNA-specific exonuclease recJ
MRNTKWNIKNIPKDKDIKINNIPVDKDILKILFSRGIKSPGEIRDFLNPKLENLQNPNKLYDVEKAVKIIREAIRKNINIWIYGDYDVDGITSTAVLYLALKELGAENVSYYIPIRDEGYGLNNDALKKIKDSGGELVITVDCGVTAFEEIKFANSINLPVIITDHHNLQGKKVPEALAVINPKRIENEYTFESLAGVGTVFMLVLSLFESYGKKEEAFEYLDLVSIGTIADIVPLLSENRILTRFGLEKLPFTKNRGLAFLLYKLFNSGENKGNNPKSEYSTYDVGFIIAPVFNAAGRLKDAKMVVKLLTSDNNREIEIIVKELINKNFERKELQNRIVEMIEKNIEKNKINEDFVIIDYSPEYHHGIIGIAASKIVDTYYKPVIIMEVKEDEGIAVGSCRSIEGFNILNALQSMPELFVKFGGHSGAAGFTIPIKNIELFKRKINEYAKKILKDDDFVKIINIDKQIPMQKMSYEFFKTIELLKPFGFGNPMPTFQTKNVLLENIKFIGENKNHIMFDLKQKGFVIKNAVWFGSGEYFKELNENLFYDIVYKLKIEEFQDRYYTKAYIEDMKASELKDDTLLYYHSLYNTSFPIKSIFYTHLDLDVETPLSLKNEFDQISLFQGRKFVGRLDYNISNLLIQLKKYFNWNFTVKVENIVKSSTHNIVDILIKRDFSFECYDYTDIGIFKRIKDFLIGNMEYDSFTKNLLSLFFRQNKDLILSFENKSSENFKNNPEKYMKPENLINFLLTVGIFFMKKTGKKSLIIVKNSKNSIYNIPFIKTYFDIAVKYENEQEENYPFILFYNTAFKQAMKKISPEDFILTKIKDIEVKEDNNEFTETEKNSLNAVSETGTRFCFFTDAETKEKFISDLFENSKIESEEKKSEIISTFNLQIEFIKNNISIPENITFLNTLKKKDLKELKNIYVEYLPLENKIKLKEKLDNGEPVYSDYSVVEII